MKWPRRLDAIVDKFTNSSMWIDLSSLSKKMWVRIRSKDAGLPGPISVNKEEEEMSSTRAFARAGWWGAAISASVTRRTARALLSLIAAALLVRAGGMVNQVVISASFGAGARLDAYFVAAALPLLLVQLLSSALEAAIVPVYSRLRVLSERERASRLFGIQIGSALF